MTSGANGEWVRQGTPQDNNADWDEEQSEYGTAVSPTEWDDYSSEQSVPVAPPRAQADGGSETAGSPDSPDEQNHEPVPGQEPDAGEEYRSDTGPEIEDAPVGDTDETELEPARIDEPEPSGSTAIPQDDLGAFGNDDPIDDLDAETTRPRPIVPEATTTAVAADQDFPADVTGASTDEQSTGDPQHIEAAEYLAVAPEPAPVDQSDVAQDTDDIAADSTYTEAPATVGADDVPPSVDVDDEPTQHVDIDDMEATQAVPVTAAAVGGTAVAAAAHAGTVPDGLYRPAGAQETAVIAGDTYPTQDAEVEEERLQAQLEAERQAREQRLGAVPTSPENATREDADLVRISTDRFFPSFGLFVLRIVLAGVLGLTSFQILGSGVDTTADFLGRFPLIPEPRLVAWILGFTVGAMALLLVIGLLQRVVGFLLLAISVGSLVFIRWGNFPIFTSNVEGFIGDQDLLLAAIGLLLLSIGGGAWGIDGAFRRARAASKAERQG